jgi:hypothetical protein
MVKRLGEKPDIKVFTSDRMPDVRCLSACRYEGDSLRCSEIGH